MRKTLLLIGLFVTLTTGLFGPAVTASAPPEMVKVLIGFDRSPGPAEEAAVYGAGGSVTYTYHLIRAIAASVPDVAIQGLLHNPRVTIIEPDIAVYAVDTELDNSWGVKLIGAGTVQDGGNKGLGVKVAIIDTGIDYNHPDLLANYAGGYNFINPHKTPMDDNGHGTHVAGIVGAVKNGGGVVGVAPGAKLYALKVLGAGAGGSFSDVIAALQWAFDNGIQVTNNSYGSLIDPGSLVKAAFDNAYALGLLNIAAAGNSGTETGDGDNVIYPAKYDSVVAVAATDSSKGRASFSSTGPAVELAAPGKAIYSTLPNGSYGTMSGTSMASPHVAGVAALVIASGITDNNNIRLRLQQTTDDLGPAGKDAYYGYGLVNAVKAVGMSNQAPIANAGADQRVITGSQVYLDGTGSSDPKGSPLTYSWSFTSKPPGSSASLIGSETATPTFGADLDGTYQITLTVSDGSLKSSDDVVITAATAPTTVTVTTISYATNKNKLSTTITLKDNLGHAVAGASVSMTLSCNAGGTWNSTGATGSTGTVIFTLNGAPSGIYTTAITKVTAKNLTWDGETPYNSFTKK